jgi:cobalt-zinc-cadmium resistance protein CzcA
MQFPLFGKASKAKIKAAASREKVVESEAKAEELILNGNVSWRLAEQNLLWHQIKEFENSILPQASTIYSTASQQLKAGELNFINWMVLAEPSLQIHFQYLEKILLYQHASSALLYLSEK